jgi:hypothetical protein
MPGLAQHAVEALDRREHLRDQKDPHPRSK